MLPVIIAEKESISEAAVRTFVRASDTPVRSETTTKMFKGTRKSEASYRQINLMEYLNTTRKNHTVARCSFEINVPRNVP